METAFFLMAQYGQPVIPVDRLVKDYFSHLTLRSFLRKVDEGRLDLDIPTSLHEWLTVILVLSWKPKTSSRTCPTST